MSESRLSALETLQAAKAKLERLQSALREIESRADEYRQGDDREGYFFLVRGIATTSNHHAGIPRKTFEGSLLTADHSIQMTHVDNFPSEIHLMEALAPGSQIHRGLISHSRGEAHELFIGRPLADSLQHALNLAHRVLFMLRIRTSCFFTVPVVSDVSWNQMAGLKGSVNVTPLGQEWAAQSQFTSSQPADGDFDWVVERAPRVFELYEMPQFRLAFDALNHSPFEVNPRMSVASSWSGIEALLGVEQELSYRVAMYTAVLLEADLDARITLRARVRTLYGQRSKAVHGAALSDAKLRGCARDSWDLLRMLVLRLVESSEPIPTPDDIDARLLGTT